MHRQNEAIYEINARHLNIVFLSFRLIFLNILIRSRQCACRKILTSESQGGKFGLQKPCPEGKYLVKKHTHTPKQFCVDKINKNCLYNYLPILTFDSDGPI